MEAEVREILTRAVAPASRTGLGTRLRDRFRGLDVDLDIPSRTDLGRPVPDFAERTDAAPVIVLDTNVISAVIGDHAEPDIVSWLDAVPELICLTSVTAAELRLGAALLRPVGVVPVWRKRSRRCLPKISPAPCCPSMRRRVRRMR